MALYAFDGTWNSANVDDEEHDDHDTNVACFYEAYTGPKWYVSGVGTRWRRIGRLVGGFAGVGGHRRVDEAYNELCHRWVGGQHAPDHDIDIIGFSRGAALALDFANRIKDQGVRRPGGGEVVERNPTIRFLGLWDVVGAFGIPISVGHLNFQDVDLGHKLFVPDNVRFGFHALAMDERRQAFRAKRLLNAYEVWFRGVHSDVGGGNGNIALSSIALRWMLRKAVAAGLPVPADTADAATAPIDVNAPIRPAPHDPKLNAYRAFLAKDRFHYTVHERGDGQHNNPPADFVRETVDDEAKAVPIGAVPPKKEEPATPK